MEEHIRHCGKKALIDICPLTGTEAGIVFITRKKEEFFLHVEPPDRRQL